MFLFATTVLAQSSVTTPNPDVVATTGDTTTSTFRILNSANTELFRVTADGTVRAGTSAATFPARFSVTDTADANSVLGVENMNATGASAAGALRAKADTAYVNLVAHGTGRTLSRYGQVLGGWTEILQGNGNGLAIGTINTTPIILATNNVDRLHILSTGEVGMGITAPTSRLHVFENADINSIILIENPNTGTTANATLSAKSDTGRLDIKVHSSTRTLSRFGKTLGGWSELLGFSPNGLILGTYGPTNLVLGTNSTNRVEIGGNGGVNITGNVSVAGTLSATQIIGATYQDVAEWVDAGEKLTAGMVVVVARDHANQVIASTRPYDTRVAGVVSDKPGVVLGVAGDSKAMVATTGRVRVHVDAAASPIEIGDLLVSSTKPGSAMKSIPVDVSGIEMHRPGTLIGKALEALPSGQGDILVLLSLQ
jgi:hypothetical protein